MSVLVATSLLDTEAFFVRPLTGGGDTAGRDHSRQVRSHHGHGGQVQRHSTQAGQGVWCATTASGLGRHFSGTGEGTEKFFILVNF